MTMNDPRFKAFDRRPPEGLDADGTPLSEVLRAMSVTASILEAFGYRQRPLGRWRRFVWDSPQRDNGKPRATIETSDSCVVGVIIETADAGMEGYTNDLALIVRLVKLHREGIGRVDVDKLIVATQRLALSAGGVDQTAIPDEILPFLFYEPFLVDASEHPGASQ